MPVVHITTWKTDNEEQIKAMAEAVTLAVNKTSGAPLDKISVVISEVSPSRWCDAGVMGNDPEFAVKSRRKNYEE